MNISTIILVGSTLLLVSVIVGRAGVRLGIPSLFLFLLLGMLFGSDGLGLEFHSAQVTQIIGMLALSIILFSGGMNTHKQEIKPVLGKGILLSTVGVILTTVFVGLFIYYITRLFPSMHPFSITESFLLSAVMSSTDSASVFSLLRSKRMDLKEHIRPILELESGSNDPMAYMLTLFFITLMNTDGSSMGWGDAIWMFFLQLGVGIVGGVLLGYVAVWIMNKLKVENQSMYPILLIAFVFLTYSLTDVCKGNGYLAVYIAGLVVGNHKIQHKRNVVRFFDGFTWLFQIGLFLTLGLLVNPTELLPVTGYGILIGCFLIFIGRPLSVFITLMPFRKMSFKAKLYISWVGLRGAVPIIFATYPVLNNLMNGSLIFNIVFFCTLLSLLVQGTTITHVARWLGVGNEMKPDSSHFSIELTEDIKTLTSEMVVTPELLSKGERMMDVDLPDSALVVMLKRHDRYFIPKGSTVLKVGDTLLIISDSENDLKQMFENHNVKDYVIRRN